MGNTDRRHTRFRRVTLATFFIVALGVIASIAVPSIRWRLQIVALQVSGKLPGVNLKELLALLHPQSGQDNLARMITTRNPFAVIRNPLSTTEDVSAGAIMFRDRCAVCHGVDASGNGAAPALVSRQFQRGASDWGLYKTIQGGVPGTAMPAHDLGSNELWKLVAHIRALGASARTGDEERGAVPAVNLPYAELAAISEPQGEWLTYSGSYSSTRHSQLTQIGPANVRRLGVRWIHQFPGQQFRIEASPIVRNGVMFITLETGEVRALDAGTGKTLWTFKRDLPEGIVGGEAGSTVNRGIALLDDKVFMGTWDARVIALNAQTGRVVWDTKVADHGVYYISAAPLAIRDLVVTGVGNMGGGRGFVVAYDAKTGAERWRFTAIPGPGEFGNDSWKGESWKQGGAPTWLTGSYDVQRDMLYWGVGNPKPDYDPESRAGDNLYSNSVVALAGETGKLLWHFQFTPADDKDWDSNQIPILAEVDSGHGKEPSVLWANRNGFYYVLERETGKFRKGVPFVQQTWTDGLDENGRPRPIPKSAFDLEGTVIHPGNNGATNWWAPSFDSELNLTFVPVLERGMIFYPSVASTPSSTGTPFYTAVRALNAATGEVVWERRNKPRHSNPGTGGLMSTKAKLLFGSDEDTFFALDSRSGDLLWSIDLGGRINASPITYTVGQEQFVAIAAGGDLFALSLPSQSGSDVPVLTQQR
jgi:alcohol dehydrogenase (cytochrome c)